MDFKEYKARFTPESRGRYDITPLFSDPVLFAELVEDFSTLYDPASYDAIAALDALGFVIGTAAARRASKQLILIRKGGKLPFSAEMLLKKEFSDYSGIRKSLEIKRADVSPGLRILIVDDWVETAVQVTAAIGLIGEAGGVVTGIACIGANRNGRTQGFLQSGFLRPIGIEE